jgi:hypothetical protein
MVGSLKTIDRRIMNFDPFAAPENYGEYNQVKLAEVIVHAPTQRTVQVIRKILEHLVLAERLAAARGPEITDADRRAMMQQDHDAINDEVDRALGVFIGSILSAEGG